MGYTITCNICKVKGVMSQYQGETGRCSYSRGLEHVTDMRTRAMHSPMTTHQETYHQGEAMNFTMETIRTFRTALERQINEAERIEGSQAAIQLNSRSEWRSTPLPAVGFTQGRVAPGQLPIYRTGGPQGLAAGLGASSQGPGSQGQAVLPVPVLPAPGATPQGPADLNQLVLPTPGQAQPSPPPLPRRENVRARKRKGNS